MSIRYRIPDGVHLFMVQNQPTISYPDGGKVAVDERVAQLWKFADGKSLEDIISEHSPSTLQQDDIRNALACLAEADLLVRDGYKIENIISNKNIQSGELVSVIIVAYEGIQWLKECIPTILLQNYSPIEIIIIDNASPGREMESWIKVNFPQILLIRFDKPHSFASANNIGIQASKGKFFLLTNQDIKLEPDVVGNLVEKAAGIPNCAAVATKLRFWWAPKFLNGLGNVVRKFSWGTDIGIGILDLEQFDDISDIPSACFAAALIPRKAWGEIGEMDEGFPMYYEDSEWCYRARLLGYSIRAAPNAVAYHAFGGKIPTGERGELPAPKLQNACYGRMRFAKKLIGNPLAREIVWNYFIEDIRNFMTSILRGRISTSIAYIKAYLKLIKSDKKIKQDYHELENRKIVSDSTLFEIPFDIPLSMERNGLPLLNWKSITDYYSHLILDGKTKTMPEFTLQNRRPSLLIVSNDIVGVHMAGPGMRYVEMAKVLCQQMEITLAVPTPTTLEIPGVRIVSYAEDSPETLEILVQNHQHALVSGYMILKFPFLESTRSKIIVDFYDPFFLENYYYYLNDPLEAQKEHNRKAIEMVNRLSKIGDFFICGNERQRDLWLGILAANGRINPQTLKQDETLRKLIDVVGVGIPEDPPESKADIRNISPALDAESKIVLWGGGIWNWLDPISLVKAWPEVIKYHPDAYLVFLGTRHPNPKVPQHEIVDRLINEAQIIGENGKSIIFIEWLSYKDREALLCKSHIGVTLHPIHAETRYSIRTRVLDYFWARLPVLITEGDVTSEWVNEYQVGCVVPPGDVNSISTALNEMLSKEKAEWDSSFNKIQQSLTWTKVICPLAEFVINGKPAPDKVKNSLDEDDSIPDEKILITNPFKKALYLWATRGFVAMINQVVIHIRFIMSRH